MAEGEEALVEDSSSLAEAGLVVDPAVGPVEDLPEAVGHPAVVAGPEVEDLPVAVELAEDGKIEEKRSS